jgi:hypothetical protein
MDVGTINRYRSLAGAGTGSKSSVPAHLTEDESRAFNICVQENLRIEQERIPLIDPNSS